MKKEFSKDELYERMKYIVYCLKYNSDYTSIKGCSTHAQYQDFLKESKRHCGDCTQVPASCLRCRLINIEIEAQNIVDSLFTEDVGHCGKNCVLECSYGEKKVERKEYEDMEDKHQ